MSSEDESSDELNNLALIGENSEEIIKNAGVIREAMVRGIGGLQSFVIVLLSLMIVITIVGNILVCLSVVLVRKLRSPSNYLLVSLAISDLGVAILVMPLALNLEAKGKWDLGPTLCDMWVAFDVTSCAASILNLCMISVDRYLTITRPLTYGVKRTTKRMFLFIGTAWVASVLISIPPLLVIGNEHGSDDDPQCQISQNIGYQLYATFASFYIPLAVMIILYYKIYNAAKSVVDAEMRSLGINSGNSNGSRFLASFRPLLRGSSMSADNSGSNQRYQQQNQPRQQCNYNCSNAHQLQLLSHHKHSNTNSNNNNNPTTLSTLNHYESTHNQSSHPHPHPHPHHHPHHHQQSPPHQNNNNAFSAQLSASDMIKLNCMEPVREAATGWPTIESNCIKNSASSNTSGFEAKILPFNPATTTQSGNRNGLIYPPHARGYHRSRNYNQQLGQSEETRRRNNSNLRTLVASYKRVKERVLPRVSRRSGQNSKLKGSKSGENTEPSLVTCRCGELIASVEEHNQQQGTTDQQQERVCGPSSFGRNSESLPPEKRRHLSVLRERKASITLGVIMTAFTACWLPFFILALLRPFNIEIPRSVSSFAYWLGLANSMLNPMIYVTFHHDFRKAFRYLLCFQCASMYGQLRQRAYRSQYGSSSPHKYLSVERKNLAYSQANHLLSSSSSSCPQLPRSSRAHYLAAGRQSDVNNSELIPANLSSSKHTPESL